ncbi:MAG: hypothetical protein H7Z37_03470 [Pyrinomonadaceae bacterium]|nr:hypothetical protein [Pyrinomonadaceae bacterium]
MNEQITPNHNIKFKLWSVVIGVFVLGCVCGALLNGAYRLQSNSASQSDTDKKSPEEKFERMKRELNLNESQSIAVKAIVEQTRSQIRALKNDVEPRYNEIRQNARSQIRVLLDENQQKLFDISIAEKNARRENEKHND